MTADLTIAPADLSSTCRRQVALMTGGLYAAGGEAVDPSIFRMGKVFTILGGISDGTTLLIAFYEGITEKLMWFDNSTGNEVGNGSLAAYSGTVEVIGQ